MKSRISSFLVILLFIPEIIFSQQTPAPSKLSSQKETLAKPEISALPPAPPLLSSALCGKGVYLFTMNGQPVGRESFEVTCPPEGGFSVSGHTDLRVPGATVDLESTLELDKSAIPSKFTAKGTMAGNPTDQVLILKDGTAKASFSGSQREVPYTPGSSFVAPNILYLLTFLAARYDTRQGGPQEIPVFPSMKMRMERLARDEVQATGIMAQAKPESFDRYNLQFGVISTLLWTDSKGRVAVMSVPMQNFVAVREEYLGFVDPLRTAMAAAAKAVEPDYSASPDAAFTAEEVMVKSKDVTLAGTLLLPKKGKAPFPAVITITGSGQQTRDEPIPIPGLEKYRPFRQIAESLASQGIAVLRVDDRGIGKSSGHETLRNVTTFDFADDTRSQVVYLRSRPDIDPNRIALVGHSEGGIIAPLVASSDPALAAIVLMAGTAKRGDAVIIDQSADLLDRDPTLTKEEKARRLAEQQAMLRTIAEGGDVSKLPDTVKNAWYKNFLTYDPLPTIRKVRQPVLILQGALDRQVTADQAAALEKAALEAGNKSVSVHVFPSLNHLFLPAKTGSFNEYTSLATSSIGDDVLKVLNDWLREKLRVK
ncbi:MAG: alpha/beta fold hydrolase [Acidobacteriia bacterium]|nr:alpha/beta fold hydrolase [Terriglobia bacterium]